MTSSEQIQRDELEPVAQRIAELRAKRDALAAEKRGLADERAALVAHGGDAANAARLTDRIDRIHREIEPIGDALAHLERKHADATDRHRSAAAAERLAAAQTAVDRAYKDATAARAALKAAIATFVRDTLPPLIAANSAASAAGTAAVQALRIAADAESPGASDRVAHFNVELYGDARLANVINLLQPLASSLRLQPFTAP